MRSPHRPLRRSVSTHFCRLSLAARSSNSPSERPWPPAARPRFRGRSSHWRAIARPPRWCCHRRCGARSRSSRRRRGRRAGRAAPPRATAVARAATGSPAPAARRGGWPTGAGLRRAGNRRRRARAVAALACCGFGWPQRPGGCGADAHAFAQRAGRRIVHGLGNRIENDAVGGAGVLDGAEAVEHVVEHFLGRPLQRVAEAAAAGAVEHVHVAGGDAQAGKLRRHVLHSSGRATL